MKQNSSKYKLIRCTQCDKEYVAYKTNTICPYCGQENKFNHNTNNKYLKITTAIALFLLVCSSLIFWNTFFENSKKLDNLSTQLEEQQAAYNDLSNELTETQNDLEYYQEQYSQSQEELKKYQDQQQKVDNLTKQLSDLQGKYDTLNQENLSLKSENENLKTAAVNASSQESIGTYGSGGLGRPNIQSYSADGSTSGTTSTVWITASGSKYHNKPDCGNSNPATSTQITLSEAQARGYEPCSKCY